MRVYLAPHHDDILLSLPSWLLCASEPSCIVVVFSEESDETARTCRELHHELGIDVHELGLLEARRRGLSLRACFGIARTPIQIQRESAGYFDVLLGRLQQILEQLGPQEVIGPLLPLHFDHGLTRTVIERLHSISANWRLSYYEDQPYASLIPAMTDDFLASRASPVPRECGAPRRHIERLWDGFRGLVPERDLKRALLFWGRQQEDIRQRVWPAARSRFDPLSTKT